jgi:putative transferase (TIGR04331 family)
MILVTTALEETFPQNTKDEVLFLGEWCKIYSKKDYWSKFNSKTLNYHWDDRDKLYLDYQYLTGIYEKYLFILSEQLNLIHGEGHSLRYWRIIIGPWLRRFIDIVFDRHATINKAIIDHNIDKVYAVNVDFSDTVPVDMHDFNQLSISDEWNHFIYSFLIEKTQCNTINIGNSLKIKHAVLSNNTIKKISMQFNRLNDVCFYASYIERFNLLKLQLSLKQLPAFDYIDRVFIDSAYDKSIRSNINLISKDIDDFESSLIELIRIQIPKSYLESYKELKEVSLKRYTSKTKAIVTANGQYSFDDFKIWSATQVENKAKLIIAQHGGHYGTGLFSSHEEHEIKISDRYFSWGWEDDNSKVIPMPANKLAGKINGNPNGDILIVIMNMPRYHYLTYSVPISTQYLSYLNQLISFVSSAKKEVREYIKIRTYHQDYNWCVRDRIYDSGLVDIVDNDPKLVKSFKDRLQDCRLYIATYNATTFLETFAFDFPTLIFFNSEYWELNSNAKKYFDKLEQVGILHYSEKSLNIKLMQIYKDPMDWWMGVEVQKAKDDFCLQFASTSNTFVQEWNKEINKLIKND